MEKVKFESIAYIHDNYGGFLSMLRQTVHACMHESLVVLKTSFFPCNITDTLTGVDQHSSGVSVGYSG